MTTIEVNEYEWFLFCRNCHRTRVENQEEEDIDDDALDSYWNFYLSSVSIECIKSFKYKFCLISKAEVQVKGNICLCNQCKKLLTSEQEEDHLTPEYCWPAFICSLLDNDVLHEDGGAEEIWKCLPIRWREWWLLFIETKRKLRHLRLQNPSSLVMDMSLIVY